MVTRSITVVLALLFACALAVPQAHALSVPGLKSEKEKKKEEEKRRQEEEAKRAAAQKSTEEKKEEPKAAVTQPAAAPAAPAAEGQTTTSEMTVSKEAIDGYKDLKVGAFVEYTMPTQAGAKMRYEVTEKSDASITIVMTSVGTGYSMKTVTKFVLKEEQAKVSAANKELNCAVSVVKSEGQVQSKTYTSKEIPQLMGGMVKMEGPDGKPTMLLSDFGAGK